MALSVASRSMFFFTITKCKLHGHTSTKCHVVFCHIKTGIIGGKYTPEAAQNGNPCDIRLTFESYVSLILFTKTYDFSYIALGLCLRLYLDDSWDLVHFHVGSQRKTYSERLSSMSSR
jgi:hypothetical protein